MFRKIKLKKQIRACIREINLMEQRRSRSQAALVSAILTGTTPADDDVDYFNRYTAQINETRDCLHQLQQEYETL